MIRFKYMKIGSNNNLNAVKAQYSTSDHLNIRKSFHDRYSTNRQGYGNWIVSNYEIKDGMEVLELGCGTGNFWLGQEDIVSRCKKLYLTDLSEGMLSTAKENLGERDNIGYLIADIQNIPFEDGCFDLVIANSMLYHVPDLEKALHKVRRVLKENGIFYCATMGENNFVERLAEWFRLSGEEFSPNHNFTMQNGEKILRTVFKVIEPRFYEDSLHITDIEELISYLQSLNSLKTINDLPEEKIRTILMKHSQNGIIDLPKDYGMFTCK